MEQSQRNLAKDSRREKWELCMRYIKVYWKYTITKPRLKGSTFGRG